MSEHLMRVERIGSRQWAVRSGPGTMLEEDFFTESIEGKKFIRVWDSPIIAAFAADEYNETEREDAYAAE